MSYQFTESAAPSSFGFSPNVAALLCYIWIPVTSILVLVTEKQNRVVRFHAFQSLFLGLSIFAATIILSVVIGILTLVAGAISASAGILVSIVSLLVWLVIATALLGVWILCLVKAYRGGTFKLPIVGKFAESMTNK
jgi:uncharacterized membrane protein